MTTAAQTISPNSTVLIVEDHPLFCDALSMTLNDCLSISDIKTASCMADALDLLKAGASPDIIILDLNLPDVSGMDGLLRLKSAMPGTPVVVVSGRVERDPTLHHPFERVDPATGPDFAIYLRGEAQQTDRL